MTFELIISAFFHIIQAFRILFLDYYGDVELIIVIAFLLFEIAILFTMIAKNFKTYKSLEFVYGLVYLGLYLLSLSYGETSGFFAVFSKIIYPFMMYFGMNNYLKEQEKQKKNDNE